MSIQKIPLDTSASRLPISVITGFLGSGKTTLLNKLLCHPSMQRSAVIINEFGNVSIDHLLVRSATEDIVVMKGGCVCCTVRGDLVETLHNLFIKRTRLEIGEFDRVVIETTGLADPGPVIHTLLNDSILKTYFRLDGVITTVDCVYGVSQLDQHYETAKQIAVADRLVLTKTDIAQQTEEVALRQRLYRINPAAQVLVSVDGNIDVPQLFNAGLYNPVSKSLDAQRWLQAQAYQVNVDFPKTRSDALDKLSQRGSCPEPGEVLSTQSLNNQVTRHDNYIQSFCLEYTQPLSWVVLNRWFQQLTALRGKDLLRVKGIVHTVESDLPVVIQAVQHLFQPPTMLPAWPDEQRRSQIVFITRNIDKSVLERTLDVLIHSKNHVEACAATLILLGCA